MSAQQKQAATDAGKVSADGIAAYRDVHLARLAIYEAKPDQARMFVSHAQSALAKAKTDAAAFSKAEADLKPPAGMSTAATMAGNDAGTTADAKDGKRADAKPLDANQANGQKAGSTEAVTWLPVDAQLVLSDDFTVQNKDQAKAVDDANQNLKAGDQKGALERLKLAGVDVDFTMAVVPLAKTTQGVDEAAKLIADGKYYEANTGLKQIEDGVRFDVVEATTVPKPGTPNPHAKSEPTTGSTSKPTNR